MRKLIFTAVFSLASLASAQSSDDNSLTEGGATFSPEDDAPAPQTPSSTGKASAPGQQHTVEKGDTLWDLSQKFLGSPWYWPKVWSYNPEIANPHWIYPGNEVRFYGQGEEVPTQVEAGQPEEEVEQGEMYDDKITSTGQIGYRVKSGQALLLPGFVTQDEVESSGRIYGSFSERIILGYPENIYVQFSKKAPKLGETYVIFRNEGEVVHPITLRPVGYFTSILAEAKVTRIDGDKRATIQITKQYDEVVRGDLLGPVGEPLIKLVAARPNTKEVKDARLVSEVRTYLTNFGENQLAIMDKGGDDGVKVGNVFTFWRQNDPFATENLMQPTNIDDDIPREDVGQCVAVEVKAKSTICLISRSVRELVRGERAEIRVRSSPPRASR